MTRWLLALIAVLFACSRKGFVGGTDDTGGDNPGYGAGCRSDERKGLFGESLQHLPDRDSTLNLTAGISQLTMTARTVSGSLLLGTGGPTDRARMARDKRRVLPLIGIACVRAVPIQERIRTVCIPLSNLYYLIVVSAFGVLAKYNTLANRAYWEILRNHEDLCLEPQTTHFGSILGLLSHVILSDVTWMRRLGRRPTSPDSPLALEFSSPDEVPFATPKSWFAQRSELDHLIEEWIDELSKTEIAESISYRSSSGKQFSQAQWQILLHVFNHQTHHRGQIAQILDDRGIANDASNLIWYFRE